MDRRSEQPQDRQREEVAQGPAAAKQDIDAQKPESTSLEYLDVWERPVTGYTETQGQKGPQLEAEQASAAEAGPGIEGAQVWKAPAGIEVNSITDTTGSMGGTVNVNRPDVQANILEEKPRLLDDDATITNVMPGDNIKYMSTDQQVISGDHDNMQAGPAVVNIDGKTGSQTADIHTTNGTDGDVYLRFEPARLGGDEPFGLHEEPGIEQIAAQRIDGDPDRPIPGESQAGNLTSSEQRKWDQTSNTAEPQPIEPPVAGFTGFGTFELTAQDAVAGTSEAMIEDRPLEFIIGDMMPGNGVVSSSNSTDDTRTPPFDDLPDEPILGQYPTGNFAEQSVAATGQQATGQFGDPPLDFKLTSNMQAESVADGDSADAALGGPDTTSRIVGLPDVPSVAGESLESPAGLLESMEGIGDTLWEPNADPIAMTKADIVAAIDVEPDTYDQPDVLASSLDDDDDPIEGL